MHDLGFSVSPSALHRKKRDIVLKQEERIDNTVARYVSERRDIMTCEKIIKDYEDTTYQLTEKVEGPIQSPRIPVCNMHCTLLSNGCGAQLNAFTTLELWDCSRTAFSSTKLSSEVTFSMNYRNMHTTSAMQKPETVVFDTRVNKVSNTETLNSSGNQENLVAYLKKKMLRRKDNPCTPIEILGDNVDILITPANMTSDRQRKSWHWFLLLATQKRIIDQELPTNKPVADIETISSCVFFPSKVEILDFQRNIQFHVARILSNFIGELKSFEKLLPNYIPHPQIEKTSQKSVFINCDLIDESENSSDGMIRIMQRVHSLAVPFIDGTVEKVVLGGDVLTNERAMSAQQAMRNNESSYEKLLGVIHRPEGLHRQMNFLMVSWVVVGYLCEFCFVLSSVCIKFCMLREISISNLIIHHDFINFNLLCKNFHARLY